MRPHRSLLLILAACGAAAPPPEAAPAPAPVEDPTRVQRLARITEGVEVDLPSSNLPPGRAPGQVPLREAFVRGAVEGGAQAWTTSLPVGIAADDAQLSLIGPGGSLPRSAEIRPGTWEVVGGRLVLRTSPGAAPPEVRGLKLRSEALAQDEGALSLASSGLEPTPFAFRRMVSVDGAFDGVYLPAPASVTWTLSVPPGAVFDAQVRLVPSPVAGAGSDGADVVLEELRAGGPVELGRAVVTREGTSLHVVLAESSGEAVKLRLRSDPGVTRFYDYIQVVDPTVFVPRPEARRVVMIQVSGWRVEDALRGADKGLATLVQAGVVFDRAYTTAPWTLPATRSVLSGDHPERWAERPTLAERLTAAGFTSLALFDDPLLTGRDGLDRGWTVAEVTSGRGAARVADEVEGWLRDQSGRDALLLVQLGDVERALTPTGPNALEWWVVPPAGRPVSPAAALDAAIGRIVAAAGPTAWVLAYADHGLVMQGTRAHHADTLADDVVRVPLLVHGPTTPAVHRSEPVSLIDLAPTVLELVGLQVPADIPGRSLAPLLTEPVGDVRALAGRALAFGRVRGDATAWGLVDGDLVWRTGEKVPEGVDPEARLDQTLGAGMRPPRPPASP